MHPTNARLTSWALVIGSVIATVGYASAFAANGNGDARFAGSSWVTPLHDRALRQRARAARPPRDRARPAGRSPVLTRIGYAGVFVPLAILNIGEGTIEGFVKPYLATTAASPPTTYPD